MANVLFNGDVVGSWNDQFSGAGIVNATPPVTPPTPFSGAATTALKCTINPGQAWTDGRNRNEVLTDGGRWTGKLGTEVWFAWYELFTQVATNAGTDWNIFSQCHLNTGGTQPTIIECVAPGGIMRFKTSTGGSHVLQWDDPNPIVLNKWYKIVIHAKFSNVASGGIYALWVNDVNVVPQKNVALMSAAGDTLYQKCGFYRDIAANIPTETHYIYNYRIYDGDPRAGVPPVDPGGGGGGGGGTVTPPVPGFPAVSNPADAIFGNTDGTPTLTGTDSVNVKRGSSFALGSDKTITGLKVLVDGNGGAVAGAVQPVKGAVYNAADALVATGTEVAVSQGLAQQYLTLPLPSTPLTAAAGPYTLAMHSGNTTGNQGFGWAMGGPRTMTTAWFDDIVAATPGGWIRLEYNDGTEGALGRATTAVSRGLKVMILFLPPVRAPMASADVAAAVTTLANSISGLGYAVEFWNEPNNNDFFAGADPVEYARMIKVAYSTIKAIDPSIQVIAGGTAPSSGTTRTTSWYTSLFGQGCNRTNSWDHIGHHPYTGNALVTDASRDFAWDDAVALRTLLDGKGEQATQVWGTEAGWTTTGTRAVSQAEQADIVGGMLSGWAARGTGYGPFFIYTLVSNPQATGDGEDGYGVLNSDLSQKTAYGRVVSTVASLSTTGTVPVVRYGRSATGTLKFNTDTYSDGPSNPAAAWTTDPATGALQIYAIGPTGGGGSPAVLKQPTSLSAQPDQTAKTVQLTAVFPADPVRTHTYIYRRNTPWAGTDFTGAFNTTTNASTGLAENISFLSSPGDGTWYYAAFAEDASGNRTYVTANNYPVIFTTVVTPPTSVLPATSLTAGLVGAIVQGGAIAPADPVRVRIAIARLNVPWGTVTSPATGTIVFDQPLGSATQSINWSDGQPGSGNLYYRIFTFDANGGVATLDCTPSPLVIVDPNSISSNDIQAPSSFTIALSGTQVSLTATWPADSRAAGTGKYIIARKSTAWGGSVDSSIGVQVYTAAASGSSFTTTVTDIPGVGNWYYRAFYAPAQGIPAARTPSSSYPVSYTRASPAAMPVVKQTFSDSAGSQPSAPWIISTDALAQGSLVSSTGDGRCLVRVARNPSATLGASGRATLELNQPLKMDYPAGDQSRVVAFRFSPPTSNVQVAIECYLHGVQGLLNPTAQPGWIRGRFVRVPNAQDFFLFEKQDSLTGAVQNYGGVPATGADPTGFYTIFFMLDQNRVLYAIQDAKSTPTILPFDQNHNLQQLMSLGAVVPYFSIVMDTNSVTTDIFLSEIVQMRNIGASPTNLTAARVKSDGTAWTTADSVTNYTGVSYNATVTGSDESLPLYYEVWVDGVLQTTTTAFPVVGPALGLRSSHSIVAYSVNASPFEP